MSCWSIFCNISFKRNDYKRIIQNAAIKQSVAWSFFNFSELFIEKIKELTRYSLQ